MRGEPHTFWAKFHSSDDGSVNAWHPLAHHCADVAACCEALLRDTILGRRLAVLAGQDNLHPVQIARLGVLAALHDIGKFNRGFQNKARPAAGPRAGHLAELVGILDGSNRYKATTRLYDAIDVAALNAWSSDILGLLVATISHHGRPVPLGHEVDPAIWEAGAGRDPMAGIAELVGKTAIWFPEAWTANGPPLPDSAGFQHAWCGVITLADWIGSDEERFFPFSDDEANDRMPFARRQAALACKRLGLTAGISRHSLGPRPPGFAQISPARFIPRAAQIATLEMAPKEGPGSVALLEAETGSGKTEAALAYFARLFHAGLVDGLYFALPTRTAATQIYRRTCAAVEHLFADPQTRPAVVLAVPGYLEVDGTEGVRLPPFRVLWPDEPLRDRGWAAEHPKRYLAGVIAVGTVDQALLSALTVNHSHLRATALLRHLLVVDEVHASDAYMTRILEDVLDHHLSAGGHALLMSATLGAAARGRLLARSKKERAKLLALTPEEAIACPYPLVSFRQENCRREIAVDSGTSGQKQVVVELVPALEDPNAIASLALANARDGARVLVLRNTVVGCVAVQVALESLASDGGEGHLLFRCGSLAAPHHSRFAKPDREHLDQAIEEAFGKTRPAGGCVAIGTQTLEQSLDLDADLLITDLCPMDVLLQRIGRLHRHGDRIRPANHTFARTIVLTPSEPLASRITPSGDARGADGLGSVYGDLRALEATWRALFSRRRIAIPAENRILVEAATHPLLLEAIVQSLAEPWNRHQLRVLGSTLADRRLGSLNVVRRDLPFANDPSGDTVDFPSGDTAHRIPTRLGLDDRLVRFDPPVPSVFDSAARIVAITMPYHLVPPGTPSDAAAEASNFTSAGFSFKFGTSKYRYDRHGLCRESAPAEAGKPASHEAQPGPSPR